MKQKLFTVAMLALLVAVPMAPAFAQSTATDSVGGAVYACQQLSYNLYRGLSDYRTAGQVSALQQFLQARYGNQLVTGHFGPLTYANIARFQRERGVYPITGGVGPLTRAAIAHVCSGITQQGTGLTATPSSGAAPLNVAFSGTVADANQYIIEFGDGSNSGPLQATCLSNQPYPDYQGPAVSCSASTSHTYTNPGTYTATLSRYISCLYSNPRCMIAVQNLGQATVVVSTPAQSGLTITSPIAGQVYTRGGNMTISWSGLVHETFAAEQDSSIVDLYTASGVKVGTIAIASGISGSQQWRVPPFPNIYMCTMQFPNGLCGTNVEGQYYIVVTAVVGNGFDANPTVLGSAQSGVFTVQ